MFETTRPPSRGRRLFYETLPVSLMVHAAAIAGVVVAATWNVTFPQASPRHYLAFHLDAAPPPPPPPPPASRPQQPASDVRPPDEIVAPTVIPDVIPVVENAPAPSPMESAAEGGVAGGVEGGAVGGVVGGVLESVLADMPPPPPSDDRVHVARDEPLEMPVVSKPYPIYPSKAVRRGWEDTLVVRYVIGKDGRVKEVHILQRPSRIDFERPTLEAIRMWRFKPYVENGEAKEVVHELTVNYRLLQKSQDAL